MRVAIIGAGAAGLASARHVSTQGFQCDIFEMASELGGTWVYTDEIEHDKFGYPVHTAMYKDLRTNLPKEVMGFLDFPISEQEESFLRQKDILGFLNLYADHFKLRELIIFNEIVIDVRPLGDKWQIKSIQKCNKQESTNIYDVVMVCNGHYHTPSMPNLEGEKHFKGKIMHCHQYRSVHVYKDQRVLVVGAGPSGLDLALQIASVAKSVVISHHAKQNLKSDFPINVSKKPDIVRIKNEYEIEFVDGSCCSFDVILYCTGYSYNFPFLHESCGISVKDNHVQFLYQHMIHVDRPTMCFIGIPFYCCAFQMFDLQANFYCQYLNGTMTLPSNEIMRKHTEEYIERKKAKGYTTKQIHLLGHDQQDYYNDLTAAANITGIAPVMCKIWSECDQSGYGDIQNFRNYKYRILNNDSFVKLCLPEKC